MRNKGLEFIYWFSYYHLDSPSVRYRAYYPLRYFSSHFQGGTELIIPGYRPEKIFRFCRWYLSALLFPRRNSLIVIQRVHSNWIYCNLLKLLVTVRRSRSMYDTDDADYLDYPSGNIFHFMKHCGSVSVGSNQLQDFARKRNPRVLLNTSPAVDLNIVKSKRNKIIHIGWIGCFGGGHKISLTEQFFPSLKMLPFDLELTIMGVQHEKEKAWLMNYFREHTNISLRIPENINWQNEQEVQEYISSFDVGIATLLDDELHLSKSAFKLKQYMTNGVPVLSSDLPENNLFIEENINGFICRNPEDFAKRITQIRDMGEKEYAELIAGCRQTVSAFDLSGYCRNLQDFYSENYPVL